MTHPNPITPDKVQLHLVENPKTHRRVAMYHIWDEEVHIEVQVGSCLYGYPCCILIQEDSNGLHALGWNALDFPDRYPGVRGRDIAYQDMFNWIAAQLNQIATSEPRIEQQDLRYSDVIHIC